jgi:hypothetical protein
VVEAQHLIPTMKLVDRLDEQAVLEDLIEKQKPAIPRVARAARLHFLLSTPFRYPPLRHGSRFGTRNQPGIWYGSEQLRTVFAEKAYYRFLFLSGTAAELLPLEVEQTAFRAALDCQKGVDLTAPPFEQFRSQISSKENYSVSQSLGHELRQDGVEAIRYVSARDREQGANLAVLSPNAFAGRSPRSAQTWVCIGDRSRVRFIQKNAVRTLRSEFAFQRTEFEVKGRLPSPAV